MARLSKATGIAMSSKKVDEEGVGRFLDIGNLGMLGVEEAGLYH